MKLEYGSSSHGRTGLRSLLLLIISLYMLNPLVSLHFLYDLFSRLSFPVQVKIQVSRVEDIVLQSF